MLTPYFQDDQTTIYLGDNREIFPQLGHVDAVVTDPPYGIAVQGQLRTRTSTFKDIGWDKTTPDSWFINCLLNRSQNQIIFGGNYFHLPPATCWLVWDKEQQGCFADCELIWTNLKRAVRRLKYRWAGFQQEPGQPREVRLYPTQKPIAVMDWALGWLPPVQTICDPFCGSGSTLIAARKMGGVKTIGIDSEERAVEIAVKTITGETNRYRTGGKNAT